MATATAPRATLITHCGAKRLTREELRLLPAPESLGARHRPVPHAELVDAIRGEATARGFRVAREEYGVNNQGAALFGVMDLSGEAVQTHALALPGTGPSLGFRSSVDESMAIALVGGGARTFVCDNMAFAGDVFALKRKSTTGLDLERAMHEAFDRFLSHSSRFVEALGRLQNTPVTNDEARELIYEATISGVVPLRLMPVIHEAYFSIDEEARPECADRTQWGLHSAFTRALKLLTPARAWTANVAVGRLFGLQTGA